MRNFRFMVSYDGTEYSGWQTQPEKRTLQETLEKAIADLTGEQRIRVNASGRTDAGVHAVGQVLNFHSETSYSPEVLQSAVNARLPDDFVITAAEEVPLSFDANRDATRKLYRYVIQCGPVVNPFMRRYSCHSRHALDAGLMRDASRCLAGKHDFQCFETDWPNRASSVRTILHLGVSCVGEWIWIDVEADGFLYNMVRSIAGTLMNVGRGYWVPEQVENILHSKDRRLAGPTAPARGLFLVRVSYD